MDCALETSTMIFVFGWKFEDSVYLVYIATGERLLKKNRIMPV